MHASNGMQKTQTVIGGVVLDGQSYMGGYMPEIVHVFTKRDLISFDGYQK